MTLIDWSNPEEVKEYRRRFRQKPENKQKVKEYMRKYYQIPENKQRNRDRANKYFTDHREEINKKYKLRYHTDKEFREKEIKRVVEANHKHGYNKKWHDKKKRGEPKIIEEICVDFGLSDEVSRAIALDGVALDAEMKKKGII